MKNNIRILLGEAEQKMGGYLAFYSYELSNIPVKADPMALIATPVTVDGEDHKLEEVTDVVQTNDYQFTFFQKEDMLLFHIAKAIKETQPEDNIEESTEMDLDDQLEETEVRVLVCNMPEID